MKRISKSRGALALLGFLVSLGVIYAATAGVIWTAAKPTGAKDAKYSSSERLVFYRLAPGDTLRMLLPADAESLRLGTHLLLPEGVKYAPERQYVYGVDLRFWGREGVELVRRQVFTRTRQSKAEPVDGLWMKESAFTVDPEAQLTDGRELLVTIPEEVRARSSVLYVRYTGTSGALLVRAYVRSQRSTPMLSASRQDAAMKRAEARVERATFLPWEKLSAASQVQLAEEQWERLGAVGELEVDYETEAVYRTHFRLPLVEVDEAAQEALEAGHGVAVNVKGPARLLVRVWDEQPGPREEKPGASQVAVRLRSQDGAERSWELPSVMRGELTSEPVEVPDGIHTVELLNASDDDLRYIIEGPREGWLAPEALKPQGASAAVAYLPDVVQTESFVAGPGCEAVELEVGPGTDAAGRLLRLDARSLGLASKALDASELHVTLLDEKGRSLAEGKLGVAGALAPFDRAGLPLLQGRLPCVAGAVPGAAPGTVEIVNRPAKVSQPASARVFLPPATRRVRVRASHPTAVNLYGFLAAPGGPAPSAPYREEGLVGARWGHAPLDQRNWHPVRPLNHALLNRQGAQVSLVSQVRLELAGPGGAAPERPAGEAVTLVPDGAPVSQELFEPDPMGEGDAARALLTRFEPGKPLRMRFDERTPTRPELRLLLAGPEGLGSEVEVLVDGAPLHKTVLRATRSRALLPPVDAGEHEVLVRASAPGLSVTLNRPPAQGEAMRHRTVYWLDEDGLRVPVYKRETGAVTVNMVVYAQAKGTLGSTWVDVTIDGGAMRRRSGVLLPRLTRAQRALTLPASERAPATPVGGGKDAWYPRNLPITLGEDVAPGLHWVRIKPAATSGKLWARFFIFGEADAGGPQQWTRPGWELEDSL